MNKIGITGYDAICAIGQTPEEILKSLKSLSKGIGVLKKFDTDDFSCKTGSEIEDFSPSYKIPNDIDEYLTDTNRFALHSAVKAWNMAGLDKLTDDELERTAVVVGVSTSGMQKGEGYYFEATKGNYNVKNLYVMHSSVTSDLICWYLGITGKKTTIVTACSSSANAIGYGADLIESDKFDRVIVGGSDCLCKMTYSGFNSLQAVDQEYCKPFSKNRNGISLGEGAGFLVLEKLDLAVERNAKVYGKVIGYSNTCDAYHITSPHPEGRGAAKAMKQAILNADITPDMVDYVNAHGTGTVHNDAAETKAIKSVFGDNAYKLCISSPKSFFGHTLGAAGGIEAVISIIAINNNFLPPTLSYEIEDEECDLNYLPNKGLDKEVNYVISNSFAFGGNNTSILFSK